MHGRQLSNTKDQDVRGLVNEGFRYRDLEMERQENEKRRRNGQPPIVWARGWLGEKMSYFGISGRTRHPGHRPQQYIDARQLQRFFDDVIRENYRDQRLSVPRFNFIMFMSESGSLDENQKTILRDFVRRFGGGRFQELKGLPAIKFHTEDIAVGES